MPAIARPRATPTQPSCDRGTKLQYPAPQRFVGNVEPSVGQQFLDIAVAQGEAEIKPDRVLDDLGREAMAAVAERRYVDILPNTPLAPDPVSVTMPIEDLLPGKLSDVGQPPVTIEHDMEVVFRLAHRITVLNRGAVRIADLKTTARSQAASILEPTPSRARRGCACMHVRTAIAGERSYRPLRHKPLRPRRPLRRNGHRRTSCARRAHESCAASGRPI